MFIIVESGSTKADWVVVDDALNHRFYQTKGINPSTQMQLPDLNDYGSLCAELSDRNALFFYGAGADDPESLHRIQSWLKDFGFKGNVEVEGDTIAAARACFGDSEGIVCILGTGSNSCVYNGAKIVKAIPSLGYIFSDEGGGVHLGKEIIKAYFYGTMPEIERSVFERSYTITKSLVIENVYRSWTGSRYIASFADFLTKINGVWKDDLIKRVFREFVELRIMHYEERDTLNIRFVGSIAFYYKQYLDQVLLEYGLSTSEVIQQPIFNLIEYHIKRK